MGGNRLIGLGWGILGVLALFVAGCDRSEPAAEAASDPHVAETGDVEPKKLQAVDLDGIKKIIAESAAADQVLVIDFWATWCVPCVEMFPGIHQGLVDRGATGLAGAPVRAVSVTLDDSSREAGAIAFLREHDALHDAYIIVEDSAAQQAVADGVGQEWNSLVVPAILVYDTNGNLAGEFLEGGLTQAILNQVDRLLASGQENQP
jgi:thiol-disulfide isomerase/thioredoxin